MPELCTTRYMTGIWARPPSSGARPVFHQCQPSRAFDQKYQMTPNEQSAWTPRMPYTNSTGPYVPSFRRAPSVLES